MASKRRKREQAIKSTREQGRQRDEFRKQLRAAGTARPSGVDYRRPAPGTRWE